MEFRRATPPDLDQLVANRLEFATAIGTVADPEAFAAATRAYLRAYLGGGSLRSYLCVDAGEIVSSCMLCLYDTVPTPSAPTGRQGLILNVYTKPAYRRRGLAKRLLSMLLEEARALGVCKLNLDATEQGRPLYRQLGFQDSATAMVWKDSV